MSLLTVVIPSKNEPYLMKTIKDILEKAKGEIEIKAVLDNWWPEAKDIIIDKRVSYLHYSRTIGMRGAINAGVEVAKGEFILKCDAHCIFDKGFDQKLSGYIKDNWVVVPRRYALDVKNWQIEKRSDNKYPVDYMYLDNTLHGVIWDEKNQDPKLKDVKIDKLMTSQGSCWFMKKDYYNWLELLDEKTYGTFWQEFQEIGLKCWLSGGQVMVNKNTWYAHWHKVDSRGYSLPEGEKEATKAMVNKWLTQKVWHKQEFNIQYLVDKFGSVPTWK